ncbi:MAG: DNA translocase FtsK 4TM domain-containing protein, partial [Schlesneria sp.]
MLDYGRLRTDLLALAVLAMAVVLGRSLVSYDPGDPPAQIVYPSHVQPTNLCGIAGALLAHHLIVAIGAGSYFLLLALIVFDIRLFARDVYSDPITRLCGMVLILIASCVGAQWFLPVPLAGSMVGNGGYVGAWAGILLDQQFSRVGSMVLLVTATIAGVLLTGEQHLVRTAIGFLLLPITMWSKLAFGKRSTVAVPIGKAEIAEKPDALPDVPSETSEIEDHTDDPAPAPDSPISKIRINPPPELASASSTQVVVSDGNLSPETLAAIASMISPSADEEELLASAAEPDSAMDDVEQESIPFQPRKRATRSTATLPEAISPADSSDEQLDAAPKSFLLSPGRSPIRVNPPVGMNNIPSIRPESALSSEFREPHRLPDTSILDDAEAFPYDTLAARAQIAAATLEKTFQEFGLNVKVVEIDTGPVITQFELELEKGLRLSKITSLADDLAIGLRVSSVRVIAPIPGKNTVGVEVPNDVRVMVRLKELIDSCRADIDKKAIPMFLGKDASGKPLVVDMCKMPHLLIAGRTGTGKSVCLNTLIVSMLMTRSPE